ncbi:MAG: MFS transporter [Caldilineaceae bacterium]
MPIAARGGRSTRLRVYGIGVMISPCHFRLSPEQGLHGRWALAGAGLIWLLYGAVAWLSYHAEATAEQAGLTRKLDLTMLVPHHSFVLFVIAFVHNGVAWSLLGWVALFMQQTAGFSTFFSVSMISIFYVALTIGRFLCAAYAEKLGYGMIFLVLAVGITLTYPLVVLGTPLLVVIGVFLTGLSLSGLFFPRALAYGSRLYPEQTGTVTGTLSVAMTLGPMLPALTGIIADRWSFQTALG